MIFQDRQNPHPRGIGSKKTFAPLRDDSKTYGTLNAVVRRTNAWEFSENFPFLLAFNEIRELGRRWRYDFRGLSLFFAVEFSIGGQPGLQEK